MDTVLNKITIRGIVQGVGFRPFVFNLAERLNLHGWVLNNSQGVEIEAEGERDAIERFERAVRRGPAGARVDHCETTEREPARRASGFSIRL